MLCLPVQEPVWPGASGFLGCKVSDKEWLSIRGSFEFACAGADQLTQWADPLPPGKTPGLPITLPHGRKPVPSHSGTGLEGTTAATATTAAAPGQTQIVQAAQVGW